MQKRFALLGASRGLGWATYQALQNHDKNSEFLLSSRKIEARRGEISSINTTLMVQDFSQLPVQLEFVQTLKKFNPTDLIYFAGGGPYGAFAEKKWSDHQWALNTTFLYPAELLHVLLKEKWPSLRNIVLIGSSIAESKPDKNAASYAAAKHALKGLVDTIQLEMNHSTSSLRVQLFSPGYMQTDMLPPHSEPRQKQLAENPLDVAKKLITMIEKSD
jgi:short-subunit dehydrogenase